MNMYLYVNMYLCVNMYLYVNMFLYVNMYQCENMHLCVNMYLYDNRYASWHIVCYWRDSIISLYNSSLLLILLTIDMRHDTLLCDHACVMMTCVCVSIWKWYAAMGIYIHISSDGIYIHISTRNHEPYLEIHNLGNRTPYLNTCMYWMPIHIHNPGNNHWNILTYIIIFIVTNMHTHKHMYVCMCMCLCMYVCVYVYI